MKKFTSIILLISFTINFVFADAFINSKLDEQDELLDELELEMNNIRNLVASLKLDNENLTIYSESLEKRIETCNQKIDEMQETITSMRKALISNKEDTHEVISILGDMQEELDRYKIYLNEIEKKAKHADLFVQILIPTLSVPMIANGIYLYANGNENYGKVCMYSGAIMFVGAELVWNGGKFILKIW